MTYLVQSHIAANTAMNQRLAQCAAQEGMRDNPDAWAQINSRTWAASPGWDAAWESALVAHPEEDYDPGADEAVITDSMILSQVQLMLAAVAPSD